jgi:hypothetical protein
MRFSLSEPDLAKPAAVSTLRRTAGGGASRDRARPRYAKQDVAAALDAKPNIQQQGPRPPLAGPKPKVRTAEAAHTDEYRRRLHVGCRE